MSNAVKSSTKAKLSKIAKDRPRDSMGRFLPSGSSPKKGVFTLRG